MSDKDEVERLKTAIARAIGELEHQLNTPKERRVGDGNNSLRYALGALWECVSPEKDEDRKAHDCNPATMTNKELVDEFASLYTALELARRYVVSHSPAALVSDVRMIDDALAKARGK